ncbi:MAG: DUF4167 domain-containing protein [Holosporales bacterium]|jgi:hypothetical protein|nr:DUF4167 domain-containing protein [Holosporales bacterium]
MRKDYKPQNNKNTRGYYQSIYDKYINNAKEHSSSGDMVMYEYNLQYAEHYMRFMEEKFPIVTNKNYGNNDDYDNKKNSDVEATANNSISEATVLNSNAELPETTAVQTVRKIKNRSYRTARPKPQC